MDMKKALAKKKLRDKLTKAGSDKGAITLQDMNNQANFSLSKLKKAEKKLQKNQEK